MKDVLRKAYPVLCLLLAFALVSALPVSASAAGASSQDITEDLTEESPYVIGDEEDTFDGLYKRMCVNLDLKKNPIPEPDEYNGEYGTGDYEMVKVIKDDETSYETIGYVYSSKDKPIYIIRNWVGYHEEGVVIQMQVYYSTDGTYIGNIRFDLTNGLSNSSSRMPYYIPSQGTHKLK